MIVKQALINEKIEAFQSRDLAKQFSALLQRTEATVTRN